VVGALSARGYTKYTDQEFVRGGQLVTDRDLRDREREREREREVPVGVNPSNPDIAGTLPSNQQGGQRTTDIAGAYVYRKSRRAQSVEDAESWVDDGIANTLNQFDTGDTRTTHVVAAYNVRPEYGNGADLRVDETDVHPTLAQQTHLPGYDRGIRVQEQATVRRLTPMECERLMGWPDGFTDIPWNKKDHAPDSRRYAACGNGVVAPVAYWIGTRLAEVLRES